MATRKARRGKARLWRTSGTRSFAKSGQRTVDELSAELETSLRNLRTDWIDVYQSPQRLLQEGLRAS